MPILNRIGEFAEDMKTWRRHLHQNPELQFDCHETAAFVVARLREFGVDEIHEGIGQTGVVGIIEGQGPGPTIGLRADMDALPIQEARDIPHKSKVDGKMHACGHDGHTTMLLGAARYLAETRNFAGRVALIFQPAEEGGGGGDAMVRDGMMERFDIAQVYGMHNWPGLEVGKITMTPGPTMAAADQFDIRIRGYGAHAAYPHKSVDPVMIAVQIAQAMQTLVSRNTNPVDTSVVSITRIEAGTAYNVIAETATLCGDRSHAERRDAADDRDEHETPCRGHRGGQWRVGRGRLPVRLPGNGERWRRDRVCPEGGAGSVRRGGRECGPTARNGGRRFLVHAGKAPWGLCLRGAGRHGGTASSRVRFQR